MAAKTITKTELIKKFTNDLAAAETYNARFKLVNKVYAAGITMGYEKCKRDIRDGSVI